MPVRRAYTAKHRIDKNNIIYVGLSINIYTIENLIHKKPTGCSYCLAKSELFVSEYGKDSYIPIIFHDIDLVHDIGYKTLIV